MNIEFLATVAVIAPDPPASRKLYVETLGLPLEGHGGDYFHSEQIAGCKSLGIWPLSQAAETASRSRAASPWGSGRCPRPLRRASGPRSGPGDRPVPQVGIEFDVAKAAAVGPAARELEQAGYELLHAPRREPWGQTVARLRPPVMGSDSPGFVEVFVPPGSCKCVQDMVVCWGVERVCRVGRIG